MNNWDYWWQVNTCEAHITFLRVRMNDTEPPGAEGPFRTLAAAKRNALANIRAHRKQLSKMQKALPSIRVKDTPLRRYTDGRTTG